MSYKNKAQEIITKAPKEKSKLMLKIDKMKTFSGTVH